MRVLLGATRLDLASADVAAATAAEAWEGRADVRLAPLSDGEGDLADVAAHYLTGQLTLTDGPTTILDTDGTWVVDLSTRWTDSAMLGRVLARGTAAGVRRFVISLPRVAPVDMGRAALRELDLADIHELGDFLSRIDLTLVSAGGQPLLGVNGLPRLLARRSLMTDEAAQELEVALGPEIPGPARPMILGAPDPKADYAGIGGGAGLTFVAAGARWTSAGRWLGSLVDSSETDLLVAVTGDVGLELPPSVIAVSRAVAAEAVPAVLVYDDGALLRHELATFGLSGAYPYAGEGPALERLRHAMGRVAQTWAR